MPHALLVHVRLHEGRYNGEGDWPPCPARLFQALVAAAGYNGVLSSTRESIEWLQAQQPPIVGAPRAQRTRQRVMFYMPNNDLDAVGGDPRRIAEVRSATKVFQPYLFDQNMPFLYAWTGIADEDKRHAGVICSLADLVFQLGRGIDMAWAWGEVVNSTEIELRLADYPGKVFRPSGGNGGTTLLCPHPPSLASLDRRHEAYRNRFSFDNKSVTFRKAPPPSFKRVSYNCPPKYSVFELRSLEDEAEFSAWPPAQVSALVIALRDAAVRRLEVAFPDRKSEIARILIGRKPDGTNDGPSTERVRIIPLPSVGHHHADRAIRRVVIEVPGGCPLEVEDVSWSFSGLQLLDSFPRGSPFVLTPANDEDMLRHYGINDEAGACTFFTVTPVALSDSASRRRIEPTRKFEEAETKQGSERANEITRAAGAVIHALRHLDIRTPVEEIRVQREPFDRNGERVESFAAGTRFSKHQLWHVRITFSKPTRGPLVIGNGRFLGLGLLAMELTTGRA